MNAVADTIRAYLLPTIAILAGTLAVLFVLVLAQRVIGTVIAARRRRLASLYRNLVDAWLIDGDAAALEHLAAADSGAHRAAIGHLLVNPLQALSGVLVERAGLAVERLGLADAWIRALRDRRWWRRAEAARALGLARAPRGQEALVAALADEHSEVRAAAVEALGRLGNADVLPLLIAQLRDSARHQRVRVIEALRGFGAEAAQALAQYGEDTPDDRPLIADVLGWIGSGAALDVLLGWCDDPNPETRAAAWRAIGTIGVGDRTFYYALRAIGDDVPEVRAMAARALGRSRRADALPYLAPLLDDVWIAAAHAARAVQQFGTHGAPYLTACAESNGRGAAIARQMLWEARPHA